MKTCGRCDQPIRDDEQYTTHDIPSPTSAGITVHRHARQCQRIEAEQPRRY